MQLAKARGWDKLDLRASFFFGNRKFGSRRTCPLKRCLIIKKKIAVQKRKNKKAVGSEPSKRLEVDLIEIVHCKFNGLIFSYTFTDLFAGKRIKIHLNC